MRHVISTTAVALERDDDDASSALRQGASSLVMMMTMTFHLRVVCEEEWSPERREKKTGSIVAALPSSLACRSAARAAVARAPSTESSPSSPSTA